VFQTRPGGPCDGRPLEAEHCTCLGSVHRGRCARCGKWPERTVRDTFAAQARRAARGQRELRPALTLLARPAAADAAAIARTVSIPTRRAA
jgi:hypothetical protein